MIKKIANKTSLRIIATLLLLALAGMFYTVGAWMAVSRSAITVSGEPLTVQAANIEASYVLNFKEVGIPGETQPVEVTASITHTNSRPIIFEISLKDFTAGQDLMAADRKVGTIDELVVRAPKDSVTIFIFNDKIYGLLNPTDADGAMINAVFALNLTYLGREVIEMTPPLQSYDGNVTQGDELDLPKISIRYCQATEQAVKDVFELTVEQFNTIMGIVTTGGG